VRVYNVRDDRRVLLGVQGVEQMVRLTNRDVLVVLIVGASVTFLGVGCNRLTDLGLLLPCTNNASPSTVPGFSAAKFTNPTRIDNQYFPLVPGATRSYMSETEDGVETSVVEVLDETREVMGVTCRVVRDRVSLDGVLIEDTHDRYAQDDDGNVWYMGEEVDNYNYDDEGTLVDITHEGAWEAGQDPAGVGAVAKPGYLMKASPVPGDTYHQEYYKGMAEDMGEVIALNVSVMLGDGTSYVCLQTRDFTPLEPDVNEYKYYAPGVGVVLEESVAGGERVELVDIGS
jgi:hypothetical protein